MKLGLECPKKLYYYDDYKNQDSGNEFLEILAEGGYQVGELAKYYYKFHYPDYHYAGAAELEIKCAFAHYGATSGDLKVTVTYV